MTRPKILWHRTTDRFLAERDQSDDRYGAEVPLLEARVAELEAQVRRMRAVNGAHAEAETAAAKALTSRAHTLERVATTRVQAWDRGGRPAAERAHRGSAPRAGRLVVIELGDHVETISSGAGAFRVRRFLPRLFADDATPEALTSLMADNGGRMALISDGAE